MSALFSTYIQLKLSCWMRCWFQLKGITVLGFRGRVNYFGVRDSFGRYLQMHSTLTGADHSLFARFIHQIGRQWKITYKNG